MNRTEIVQLCRLVKAVCPSQAIDQLTPDAWTLILGHVAYEDAKAAVLKISKDKGRDAAVTVLSKFGVQKLPDLKPENYGALVAAVKEVLEA